jgi:hypothetical protein
LVSGFQADRIYFQTPYKKPPKSSQAASRKLLIKAWSTSSPMDFPVEILWNFQLGSLQFPECVQSNAGKLCFSLSAKTQLQCRFLLDSFR